ncbi:hypothetical protein K438DRAFT_1973911 [Mycena galopus ATCC 62051]|nr:hypothetical protein K438DRAFT_1973911 [Mycena galopus ATCC 62051]
MSFTPDITLRAVPSLPSTMYFNPDITLGALLVGTWASSILYTIEVIQAAYYYRHFKDDKWMFKLLVSCAIAIDSVSMIANYASVYLYIITHWGDLAYLQNHYWPYPLYVFTTSAVAALVQCYLAARYWLLAKSRFITLTLFFFIMVAIGGGFASALTLAMFPEYRDREKVIIPATAWLISEAVTDISIASALLLEFWKARSSFKENRSLLNRLVVQTIQTGTTGATIALATLIAFMGNHETNVSTGIAYCLGRVYCITMLVNLNYRETRKTWPGERTSSGANPETRCERLNQERIEGGDDYDDVHRTAVVHIDTPQEFSGGSFKPNGLPEDSPAVEIKMTVNDSASYSSKMKQNLFTP